MMIVKIIWKYEKIWCVREKAEYKLVHVVLYEYIRMRKITGGYGTKKGCYVGIEW